MKNKKLALLLAAVLTVTSADSTVMIASGADFPSEAVAVEEESEQQTADEDTSVDNEDEISTETEPEADFSSQNTIGGETVTETEENEETEVAVEDDSEELFSDEAGESTSIIPDDVQVLTLDTDYTVNIDENNRCAWFSFTPEEDGNYIFSSTNEDGSDPKCYIYDRKEVTDEEDYWDFSDDGLAGDSNFRLSRVLQKGHTYYYCAKLFGEESVGSFAVNLTKARTISSITVTDMKTTLAAGFESENQILAGVTVTVKYDDNSEYGYQNNGEGSFTDPDGNYIYPMILQGEDTMYYYPDSYLDVGNYSIYFNTLAGDFVSDKYSFQMIPVKDSDIYAGEITEGENKKDIQSGEVVSFKPEKSRRYVFSSLDSKRLDITVKTENDGIYTDVDSQNGSCSMDAGTTYYIRNNGEAITGMTVSEMPEIDRVTVDASGAKTVFQLIQGRCFAEGLKVTVSYKGGRDPETLIFKDEKSLSDFYGNEIRYYFQCENDYRSWNVEPGEDLPGVGTYPLIITCNGEEIKNDITVTVVDTPQEVLSELKLGTNSIESPEEYYNYYWFSPSESGRYSFTPAMSLNVKYNNGNGYSVVASEFGTYNGSNRYYYPLEKGVVYCVGFSGTGSVWDESADEIRQINNWDVTVAKRPEVVSITPSNTELTYMYGLDDVGHYSRMESEKLTVTYEANGTTETMEFMPYFYGSTLYKYGSEITAKIRNKNGEELGSDAFDENDNLKVGNYIFTFECDGIKSDPITVNVKAFDYDSIPKLTVGKNTIKISKYCYTEHYSFQEQRIWYALETGDSSRYVVKPGGVGDYYLYKDLKKINEEGNLEDVWDGDYEEFDRGWKLDKNSKYIVSWHIEVDSINDNVGDETDLTITRVPEVTSVKVKSTVPADMTFIKGMETVNLDSAVVEVTYNDGSTAEYDTENSQDDDYGRYVDYYLATRNADGSYEPVEEDLDNLPAGDYVYRISFGDVYAEDIPVKVLNLSETGADEISQDKTTEVVNKDRLILKYTATETGRYEVKFNVPVSKIKVGTEDGTEPTSSTVEKYKSYVNFEKGTTYYIYIKADEYCPELTVDVSGTAIPSGLATTALKKSYIAGVDRFTPENFQTEVTLEDQKTRTVRGTDKVGGYYLQYKAQNKDTGKIIYGSGRLTPGTWEVTAYLSAYPRTGSEAVVEMAEIPATSTEITVEKLDLSKLPKFTLDQAEELKNNHGERQWYSFTAEEAGLYYEEQQSEDTYAEHLSFYRDSEDGYVMAGEAIDLEKGETCLVQVTTDQDTTAKIVRQKNESGEDTENPDELSELPLQDGMEKAVYLSAGNTVECTFTPENDGYYEIRSDRFGTSYLDTYVTLSCDGEKLTTDDDSGKNSQFSLAYGLEKGKTYTYSVRFYSEETAGAFKILFHKVEVKAVKDVKLVQKEGVSTDSLSVFDDLSEFYEVLLIYEDGTEQRVDLYGSSELNYGNKLSTDIYVDDSTLTEKEVKCDFLFNIYAQIGEYMDMDYSDTIKIKGAGNLAAFELNKENTIPKKECDYWALTPAESGEYMLTVKGENSENAAELIHVYSNINTDSRGSAYFNNEVDMSHEGVTTYSLHLEKGHTYYIGAYSYGETEGNTISIKKAAKTLKGLKLLEAPEQKTCLPDGLNVLSLKGLKAQAYYTDGTSEIITYGTPDSSGRYLLHDGVEWINNDLCRAYARLGSYQISFDVTADSWENIETVKAGQLYTAKAEKDGTLIYKFVTEKSGYYQVNVSGGYLSYVKAEDPLNSQYIKRWYNGRCYMEEGKTYYLHIYADSSDLNFYVVPEGEKLPCEWEETERTEATCTEEGQVTRICRIHGEKETTSIPATGHTPGEWETTKAATAVEEGNQVQKCTVCGEVLQTKKIAKLKATIKLNVPNTLPLKVKQTFQIKASSLAKGDKVASWKSSNTKIVTVTSSGKITGKKSGTATITVKLKSGLTSQVKVKVQKSDVAATSLTVLNKSTNKKISGTVTLKAKKKLTLATTIAPVTCKQKVTFTSSNKKIATVTSSGVITAKKKGTVTITVKVGKKTAKVKIKVN